MCSNSKKQFGSERKSQKVDEIHHNTTACIQELSNVHVYTVSTKKNLRQKSFYLKKILMRLGGVKQFFSQQTD